MKKLFFLVCFCSFLFSSAIADWNPGDPYKMHYPQLPNPEGWDVCLCCQWIADDFRCTETGDITDIHFWISWNEDWIGDLTTQNLDVSIWSDAGGVPGMQLWQFVGGNMTVRQYGTGLQGWVCPSPPPLVVPNNHFQFFQVNLTGLVEPFRQIAGTTYWLVIKTHLFTPPWPNGPAVGWKTSTTMFQAPSVWSIDRIMWQPVNMVVPEIWDQAFVITGEPVQQELDYGDAPDLPYPTLLASNGARHIIRAVGPWLGDVTDSPDPEADGQPTPIADGDDIDGNDDEDGVLIPPLTIGQPSIITFEVNSNDGGGGMVYGWIDFNGNGIWGDVAVEQVVAANYPNGIYNINVTPPAGSIVGGTFARFRITRDLTAIPGPKGLLSDGEVEDYLVTIEEEIMLDFGDAPDLPYPTLLASNGARHIIRPVGPWLGDGQDNPDPEADGQPTFNADGDDLNNNDDEDGVAIPPLTIGQMSTITFEVNSADGGGGMVSGWIDFDGDGIWGSMASEQVVATSYTNGVYSINIVPPAGSILGITYARFRISRDIAGTVPMGLAQDGEVEDYLVVIDEERMLDFGDAPDPIYLTFLASNGARHIIRTVGPWLGDGQDNPDPEADGQPTPNADGDDLNNNDDEDGVAIPPLTIGQMSTITFEVNSGDGGGGMVYGWIDFNGNGIWGDMAGELIVSANYLNGIYSINIVPPAGSIVGATYARFRISRDIAASAPMGLAQDGEVEDYLVKIEEEIISDELKFRQLPLNGPEYFGHDELSTVYPVYDPAGGDEPKIIEYQGCYMADDFADLASSPVIRVKWWGSYFGNEIVQPVLSFIIAFESDIPAVGQPGQADYVPSHPGILLSQEEVLRDMDGILTPGEFREVLVGPGGPPCNEALYRYEALLQNPFPQRPDTVYWLKIVAVVELPFGHTLWQDVTQWPSGDVCDYLINGYGHLPQYYPVTRWGWHNRDYTKMDPYASTPPAVVPGEHLAGIIPTPIGTMEVWHFQDDAVFGHVYMPVDPAVQPRKIVDVFQPDWLEQYYKYLLPYCISPSQQGVDGPEEIVNFSKDLAFELWTTPETITTPTLAKTTPAPAISSRVNGGRVETFVANAVSSLGHAVEYQFTWGDASVSPWGAATQTHIYTYGGPGVSNPAHYTYNVSVQARCIAHPAVVSAVSAPLIVFSEPVMSTAAFYVTWAAWNRPDCWAYRRNCRGDTNNLATGLGVNRQWVNSLDLTLLAAGFNKTEPQLALVPNGICADFNRAATGLGINRQWVNNADLSILATYFNKTEAFVPICPQTNYHYWTN